MVAGGGAGGRSKISKPRKERATSGHLGAVEQRRALERGLLGAAAMLKCGMSGSQVKGGATFLPSYVEKGKKKRAIERERETL